MFPQRLLKSVSAVIVCVILLAWPWIMNPFGESLKARIHGCTEKQSPLFAPESTAEAKSPIAHIGWTIWTATGAGLATSTATSTMVLPASLPTPSSLLDRLANEKPSIWGDKRLYVVFGLMYVTLFGLFLKQVISICGEQSDHH